MNLIAWSLVGFIVAISILVTVHELGHFLVARYFNVKVLRFSVGFGRPIFKHSDRVGCEYTLCAIPLGGYVRMLDEREGPVREHELSLAFNRKPVFQRIAIVLAGPLANLVFAIAAFFLMFYLGVVGLAPILGDIEPSSYAANAGFKKNDEIIEINNEAVTTWQDVLSHIVNAIGDEKTLNFKVRLSDRETIKNISLHVSDWSLVTAAPDPLKFLGLQVAIPPIPPVIDAVTMGEPAAIAGLKPGDKITALNNEKMDDWNVFVKKVQASLHEPVHIRIERLGESLNFTVTPREKLDPSGKQVGYIGVGVARSEPPAHMLRVQHFDAVPALYKAFSVTYRYGVLTLKVLGKMLLGEASIKSLSGPITIAQGAGFAIQSGLDDFLNFLGLVSISLAVLNLLPIPILDGGHAAYYIWEAIFSKPVPLRIQVLGFKIGMILLLILMSIAFFNDLARL